MPVSHSRGQWWFDNAARKLYLFPNATQAADGEYASADAGPPTQDFVAVHLKTLFSIKGGDKAGEKATGITLQGVKLRDAADVTMEPWAVPSGGDWGLHRGGAVFLENTEDCAVRQCAFERIDGNGVFVSGYNRNATVADNEFAWIGHSCAAGWGYTDEQDGTGGMQPRGTRILRNYAREIGIIQKQSSVWFQAKTAQTVIEGNVMFNGPRAAIVSCSCTRRP